MYLTLRYGPTDFTSIMRHTLPCPSLTIRIHVHVVLSLIFLHSTHWICSHEHTRTCTLLKNKNMWFTSYLSITHPIWHSSTWFMMRLETCSPFLALRTILPSPFWWHLHPELHSRWHWSPVYGRTVGTVQCRVCTVQYVCVQYVCLLKTWSKIPKREIQ